MFNILNEPDVQRIFQDAKKEIDSHNAEIEEESTRRLQAHSSNYKARTSHSYDEKGSL